MAQLEFHTGLGDPLGYACRLLRKAYRRGSRVLVCGEGERLSRLDTLLWTFEQLEFLPHARLRAGDSLHASLQRTPIWLVDRAAQWPAADVVVNLGDEAVAEPERFARIIELVGEEPDQRQAGRLRWRHYVGLGLTPENVSSKPAAAAAADGNAQA